MMAKGIVIVVAKIVITYQQSGTSNELNRGTSIKHDGSLVENEVYFSSIIDI